MREGKGRPRQGRISKRLSKAGQEERVHGCGRVTKLCRNGRNVQDAARKPRYEWTGMEVFEVAGKKKGSLEGQHKASKIIGTNVIDFLQIIVTLLIL